MGRIVSLVETRLDWGKRIAASVGRQLAHYRTGISAPPAPLSLQQLSDRCGKLGYPIARSVLSKIEKGYRQSISVDEILVLAQALEVPPVLLLFPLGSGELTEIRPGEFVSPWAAIQWFYGTSGDPADARADAPMGTVNPVVLWSEHDLWVTQIERLEFHRQRAHELTAVSDDGTTRTTFDYQLEIAIPSLRRIRETMREQGMEPPAIAAGIAQILGESEAGQ